MSNRQGAPNDGVMTFEEIGARLGISRQRALQAYNQAIKKLRRRPESLKKLVGLSDELQKMRRTA